VIFQNRIYFLRYQCYLIIIMIFLCWCNVLRWIWCLWCSSECISTSGKLEKYAWPWWEMGIEPTVVRCIFQACPVWIYTQSNITSIIFTWVHYTNTEKSWL
jgi:hypothetical protein